MIGRNGSGRGEREAGRGVCEREGSGRIVRVEVADEGSVVVVVVSGACHGMYSEVIKDD